MPKFADYELQDVVVSDPNTGSTITVKPSVPEDVSAIFKGIKEYENGHAKAIDQYQKKYGIFSSDIRPGPTYFRDAFYDYVSKDLKPTPEELAYNGEYKPPVKIEELFGKQFTELYQLALEEEMNSEAYMAAVLHKSTKVYAGEKWTERPVVFVGGPSASGKTYAADSAIEKATDFLGKESGNTSGNQVTFVDGGIARDVSQVRKLAVKAANNKGYSGIKDLNKHSKALRKVKLRVYQHAMHVNKEGGVVIPETFSAFVKPGDKSSRMLREAMKLTNARTIFARTEGKNPGLFQKVVQFMGESRAWKTGNVKQKDITRLNKKTSWESKSYGKGGFRWGVLGSKLAEVWFKHNAKENLSMVIVNDLVLKREDPPKSGNYVDAQPDEAGVIKVSERVFDNWKKMRDNATPNQEIPSLIKFMQDKNNAVKSLIYTSAEIKMTTAKQKLTEIIPKIPDKPGSTILIANLQALLTSLNSEALKNPEKIRDIQKQVKNELENQKWDGKKYGSFRSEIYKSLKSLDHALTSLSNELALQKTSSAKSSTSQILQSQPVSSTPKESSKPSNDSIAPPPVAVNSRPIVQGFPTIAPASDKRNELTKLIGYAVKRYKENYGTTIYTKLGMRAGSEQRVEDISKIQDILNDKSIDNADVLKSKISETVSKLDSDSTLKRYLLSALKSYELTAEVKVEQHSSPSMGRG